MNAAESSAPPPPASPGAPGRPGTRTPSRSGRLVVAVLAGIVAVAGVAVFSIAVLPRWWAHRIGDSADGRFSAAIWLGLSVGVACTALPLILFGRAFGRRHGDTAPGRGDRDGDRDGDGDGDRHDGPGGRRWRVRAAYLVVGLLVAAPNLLTLGIELGNGRAAHAADRTLDVQAPGFRGATLGGAVIGASLVIVLGLLLHSRRRRGEQLRQARAELARSRTAGTGDVHRADDRER